MRGLTERQRQIVAAIDLFTLIQGIPPTFSDLGEAVGLLNPNAVAGHLKRLREKGVVTWNPSAARTLRTTERVKGLHVLGVVGQGGVVTFGRVAGRRRGAQDSAASPGICSDERARQMAGVVD